MKASLFVGLLAIGACASSGSPASNVGNPGGGDADANVRNVEINGGQAFPGSVEISADAQSRTPATWHDVQASPARTWQYLPIAYSKLGLAITRYDSVSHIIEGERLRSRSAFGGKELSSMMDCGDVAGMPNVTRFEVNIQVRTGLRGSGNSSSVASVVTATAKPGGVAGDLMPCTVNATAADRVAAAVVEALAAAK
ncbi:MAG TPA: hypothetical protein VIC03_13545 [Gemmatimonadaceae bacterium]|jgi:hypothetical protein